MKKDRTEQNKENQKRYTKIGFNCKKEDYPKYEKMAEQYNSISDMVKTRLNDYDNLLEIIDRQSEIIKKQNLVTSRELFEMLRDQ